VISGVAKGAGGSIGTADITGATYDRLSVKQLQAARALLGWTSAELAAAAGLSAIAVRRLEAREGILGGRRSTADKLRPRDD
jgi:hypothetical protein